ncbi:hypothetical protein CRENBAI_025665 [Crenichthys baileyi]|uniref:Uncharacterized protein n=1 Tax=Crenichthys baileyi TaxID=28760 RepID=A0AAV9SJV2_9TELE
MTTSCGFSSTEGPDNQRIYWIAAGVSAVFVTFVAAGSWMIKQRYLGEKASVRQTQGSIKEEEVQYTPINFKDKRHSLGENIPESSGSGDRSNLTTVYAKLEHPNPPTDAANA